MDIKINKFDGEFLHMNQQQIDDQFLSASLNDDKEKMQYLLVSKDLTFRANIHIKEGGFSNKTNNSVFERICGNGDIEMITFIFTSPELKDKVNIHSYNDFCLRSACHLGYVEVVKFLLDSPKLEEHADVLATDSTQMNSFLRACKKGETEIIQYLLQHDKYKTVLLPYKEEGFIEILKTNKNSEEALDALIHYFIFDIHIEKTSTLEKFLSLNYKNILDIINKRDLNTKLSSDLNIKSNLVKHKI